MLNDIVSVSDSFWQLCSDSLTQMKITLFIYSWQAEGRSSSGLSLFLYHVVGDV